MNYQIIISDEDESEPPTRLKALIPIQDAGYWQKRIDEIILDLELNERVTVATAQKELSSNDRS